MKVFLKVLFYLFLKFLQYVTTWKHFPFIFIKVPLFSQPHRSYALEYELIMHRSPCKW